MSYKVPEFRGEYACTESIHCATGRWDAMTAFMGHSTVIASRHVSMRQADTCASERKRSLSFACHHLQPYPTEYLTLTFAWPNLACRVRSS